MAPSSFFINVAVSVAFVGAVIAAPEKFRVRHKLPEHRLLLPQQGKFVNLHVAEKCETSAGAIPSGYLVGSLYDGKSGCSGSPYLASATGLDVCLLGTDADGKAVGSLYTKTTSDSPLMVNYTMSIFTTLDCSGSPESEVDNQAPKFCLHDDENDLEVKYTYVKSADDLWGSGYSDGVVIEEYDTQDSCSEGVPPFATFLSYEYCLPVDSSPQGFQSQRFSGCSEDSVTFTFFYDQNCQDLAGPFITDRPICVVDEPSDSEPILNYVKHFDSFTCPKME